MAENILRIAETAQMILDTVNANFQANGVVLPTRQYIAVGEAGKTAHDGEQVTVSFGNVSDGLPNNNMPVLQRCNDDYHGFFNVEIVRCSPTPKAISGNLGSIAPPVTELNEYYTSRMIDAWLLVRVAQEVGEKTYLKTAVYGVTFSDESGGLQAVNLSLNMAV